MARYLLLDVFTARPFAGNQLAIFPEVVLDDVTMQHVARELNLAETVFLQRGGEGGAAATLRIFTPRREIPFAGHPTIGTAVALVTELGWVDAATAQFVLQLRAGAIPIAIERGDRVMAWLTTPATSFGAGFSREAGAAMLGVDVSDVRDDVPVCVASAGSPFLYVPLRSREVVDRAVLDERAVREQTRGVEFVGVYCFAQVDDGCYARMVAPMSGISEDPATGSATGPLYALLAAHGALARRERFLNLQGVAMGRRSELHVRCAWDGARLERVEIGGNAVIVGHGELDAVQ